MSPSPAPASILLSPARSWWLLTGAVRDGCSEELAALLSEGADPNARNPALPNGPAILHLACLEGGVRDVKALLDAGASPTSLAQPHKEFLGVNASKKHNFSAASFALQKAMLANYREDHPTLVDCASKINLLIEAGLSHDTPTRRGGNAWKDMLVFEWIPLSLLTPWIQAGAPIDALDPNGRTLLFNAICHSRPEDALLLLELGADPFFSCAGGRITPAAAAKPFGNRLFNQLNQAIEAIAQRRALAASTPLPNAPKARSNAGL